MGLLNRIGAFFYERATPAVTETVGVGGAVSSGGYLNSNEASGDMVGFNRWRKTAEWKRNVGIVSAALRRFLELAGSPKWSVAPFDKSAESMKRAEFANAQIRGLATPWRTVVQVAALSRFDGFALQEWTAKLRLKYQLHDRGDHYEVELLALPKANGITIHYTTDGSAPTNAGRATYDGKFKVPANSRIVCAMAVCAEYELNSIVAKIQQ